MKAQKLMIRCRLNTNQVAQSIRIKIDLASSLRKFLLLSHLKNYKELKQELI